MIIDLYQHSIDVILNNQHNSGAYIASPNFFSYRYCWFRDASFTAYAMDLVGEHTSSSRFHKWAARVVNKRTEIIHRGIKKARRGVPLTENDVLSTRYTLDGLDGIENWPNFQLDGFGTWLWALGEHQRLSQQSLSSELLQAANLVSGYLSALWRLPCFDCWEEFPDQIHTYTLVAIYAGLEANSSLNSSDHQHDVDQIKDFILSEGNQLGYFPKFVGSQQVDANLLSLAVPYGLVRPDHPLMLATLSKIESDLKSGGGLHRYSSDTYYGGGEWVLLTAWLGWVYALTSNSEKADVLFEWVAAQADKGGNLPEQIPLNLNDPSLYEPWLQRWGEIAKPLLWSHAKYIILNQSLSNITK